jgi:chromosome segregation ATPase
MRNSREIERTITELQQRRELIAANHADAQRGLADARKALAQGQGSTEQVAGAQSLYTALDGTLSDIAETLAGMRAELEQARESESSESNQRRIAELLQEAAELQSEFDDNRVAIDAEIERAAEVELQLGERFGTIRRELITRGAPEPKGFKEQLLRFSVDFAGCVQSLRHARDRAAQRRAA